MIPAINYWAVIAATVSTMIVGAIWYAPGVMGKTWRRLAGVAPSTGRAAVRPLIATVIVSFITSWVLAGAAYISYEFYGNSFLGASVLTGFVLWAGFTAARFVTHDAFEGRPIRLTILNCVHELITILVLAVVIGVWPPALG